MHLFSLLTSAVIHVVSKGNIFQLCVTLPPAEAPAGYPNKNSNNKKIESARGTMGRGNLLAPGHLKREKASLPDDGRRS